MPKNPPVIIDHEDRSDLCYGAEIRDADNGILLATVRFSEAAGGRVRIDADPPVVVTRIDSCDPT